MSEEKVQEQTKPTSGEESNAEETSQTQTEVQSETAPQEQTDVEVESLGEEVEASESSKGSEEVAELQAKIAKLEEEKKTYYDQMLRSKADLENFRRRSQREKEEQLKYANKELFTELIGVKDNFERAMTAITDEKDPFVVGVRMIQKQLEDIFTAHGLEEIDPKGEPFNPHFHDALANEETEEFEDNTVMEVFQKGYQFKGRLLRPAQVKVAQAARKEPIDTEA